MPQTVAFTELRRNLASHLDTLEQDRNQLIVTRQGHADMVILPLAELEGLLETLHLLGTPVETLSAWRTRSPKSRPGGAPSGV